MRPLRCSMRGRVPRDVEVEEVGAVALEVHALARGVGGDEDADRVLVGRAVEGALDLLALVVGHAAVEDCMMRSSPRSGAVDRGGRGAG